MAQQSDREEVDKGPHGFVDVVEADDVPPGTLVAVSLAGCRIAVANADGRIVAFNDLCLRCGLSLASGSLWGPRLICRGCGWQYDARCGSLFGLPALRLELLPVVVHEGHVAVDGTTLPRPAQ
jgi:3-phenylpropionate/trans-cinnamate dioxygenase ferredoxin subunit